MCVCVCIIQYVEYVQYKIAKRTKKFSSCWRRFWQVACHLRPFRRFSPNPGLAARRCRALDNRSTYRPLSSSFSGLPYRILNINHKKELLRGLWVELSLLQDPPYGLVPQILGALHGVKCIDWRTLVTPSVCCFACRDNGKMLVSLGSWVVIVCARFE